jgi:phosphoglycerate dehydrogenase-like enzyme
MTCDVLCLRPEADFQRADSLAPASLRVVYRSPADTDVPQLMSEARALVLPAVGPKLPPAFFDTSTVRFVQVTGAGLDRLDLAQLKKLGISAANVPGGSNAAVAEYAVTTASILLRRFSWADAEIRAGHYREFRARMLTDNLAGLEDLTVGVVGFGIIGVAVAEAFFKRGGQILFYDPVPRDPEIIESLSAQSVSLEEVLKLSDVISLHVPLLPSTQGMIGAKQLAMMKADAVLIQSSRGGIVDETALADCLNSGRLGGVAIDVYSTEPPQATNPLFALQGDAARRILFTPHIAGVTRQSAAFLFRSAWRNVARVLIEDQPPLHCVC